MRPWPTRGRLEIAVATIYEKSKDTKAVRVWVRSVHHQIKVGDLVEITLYEDPVRQRGQRPIRQSRDKPVTKPTLHTFEVVEAPRFEHDVSQQRRATIVLVEAKNLGAI